mmetsp:Transcript_10671/g.43749  ORF Transcript_10671/g.43749 Transcript_10671/m.43749 type:complete len:316 (+) Transcript_10671:2901-3848(+)
MVLLNSLAHVVAQADETGCLKRATLCCLPVPDECLLVVLRHALAEVMEETNQPLGLGVSLVSCESVPLHSLGKVLFDANAAVVHVADGSLCVQVAHRRSLAVPHHRLLGVCLSAHSLAQHLADLELALGTAELSSCREICQCAVVLTQLQPLLAAQSEILCSRWLCPFLLGSVVSAALCLAVVSGRGAAASEHSSRVCSLFLGSSGESDGGSPLLCSDAMLVENAVVVCLLDGELRVHRHEVGQLLGGDLAFATDSSGELALVDSEAELVQLQLLLCLLRSLCSLTLLLLLAMPLLCLLRGLLCLLGSGSCGGGG